MAIVFEKNPEARVTLEIEGKETEIFENFILVGKKPDDERGFRESVNSTTLTREDFNQMLEHAKRFVTDIRKGTGLEEQG